MNPGIKVLIVEDEGSAARDLKLRLETNGFEVTGTAGNAADALQIVEQSQPDLVLMDIGIQGERDGVATAKDVHTRHDIPVVFLAAHSDTATVQKANSALCYGFLLKPFKEQELLSTIELAVLRHQNESRMRIYERAIEASTTGIILTDARQPDNPIISCNPAFEHMTGYTEAEVIGRNPRFLQGPDSDPVAIQTMREGIREGRDCQVTLLNYRKDGTSFWDEIRISPVRNASGHLTHFVGIQNDVTEQKNGGDRIRQQARLIEQATDAIFVCGLDGRVNFWNPAAAGLYGYEMEEVLNRSIYSLICRESRKRRKAILQEVHRTGEWQGEMRQQARDGRALIVQTRISHLHKEGGIPIGYMAVNHDITVEKDLERQLARSQWQETLGALAGGIVHDLSNALAPVLMGLELLKSEYPNESDLINLFGTSAGRAGDLVQQLLTFAKGAEGEHGPIQMTHLLHEMKGIIQGTFPKNINVICDYEKDLIPVMGDGLQLHQVLLNLCINARDAMPQGGTLTLRAEQMEIGIAHEGKPPNVKPGQYLVLGVEDSGTGIPPEVLDHIFDPFFTTKDPGKGAGIGLATTLGTVKSHQGFLEVESTPDQGTIFKVYLPVLELERPVTAETRVEIPFQGQGETIMFVDDEPEMRKIVQAVLEPMNFKIVLARDGIEGLTLANQHRSVLRAVITDLYMPIQDGTTFIKMLYRILPAMPVAVATGLLEDATKEELQSLGVSVFLNKPFTEGEIARVVLDLVSPAQFTNRGGEFFRQNSVRRHDESDALFS